MSKVLEVARKIEFMNLLRLLLMQYIFDCEDRPKNFNEDEFLKTNADLIKKIHALLDRPDNKIPYQEIIQKFSTIYQPFPHKYIFKWLNKREEKEHKPTETNTNDSEDILIYHYTSESTLNSFLQKDASFSVTHWKFLNDSNELFAYLEKFAIKGKEPYDIPLFLMSFSCNEDDLNLWRAYAHNGGFAIGFSLKELEKAFNEKIFLHKCIYSLDDVVTTVPYKQVFCFYKDPAFSAEAEMRLLFECPKDQENRIEIIGNKPRIRLNFSNGKTVSSFIKKIIVAPSGDIEYNYNMAKMLCHIRNINPEIVKSKVPFRNW